MWRKAELRIRLGREVQSREVGGVLGDLLIFYRFQGHLWVVLFVICNGSLLELSFLCGRRGEGGFELPCAAPRLVGLASEQRVTEGVRVMEKN